MTFTAQALLEQLEGLRLTSYPDKAGHWTIGYGHTGPEVVPGLSWTRDHADEALAQDIGIFALGVEALVPEGLLSDAQFSALVIFAYNVGLAAFRTSRVLRDVIAGQFDSVPAHLMAWDHIHDPHTGALVVDPGLVKRREAEIALWKS